jgi:hypothetical protein
LNKPGATGSRVSDPVSGGIAAIAGGRIVDRFIPVDFAASARTGDSVRAGMDFSFDSMSKSAVE